MSTRTLGAAFALIIVAIVAAVALMSGGDDGDQGTTPSVETDGAFLAGMAPHHESAIEMARVAQERADHPEIKRLADNIVAAQTSEIETIDQIHQRLFDEPVAQADHGTLGLDEHMMGMDMDMDALEQAKPFDQEFIDQMIAHHQGAIRMARIELAQGTDDEAKFLADGIVTAQSAEIEQMNVWRTEWYGEPSPSGGVPDEDEEIAAEDDSTMEGMEH